MRATPSMAFLTIIWSLTAQSGQAAVVEALDLDHLTRAADRIVVARVGKPSARFIDDGMRIITDTPIVVQSTLKGDPAPELLVRSSGGIVGEIGQQVAGSAQLMEGELAVLFLEQRPATETDVAHHRVVGMAQGKFELRPDASGSPVVVRDLGSLRFVTKEGPSSRPALRSQYYADRFLRQIRIIVQAQAEKPAETTVPALMP